MKNRVAKLVAIGKIKIFKEDLPKLKNDEVLVAIKSSGICGSDMHYFLEGGLGSFKQTLPMAMGHEPSGVVVDSKGVTGFRSGDRVAVEPGRACLKCSWCLRGKQNLCEKVIFMGANGPGAFADYVIVDKSQLVKIPDSMSYNLGALLETLGIGLHAFNLTKPTAADNATIVGSGSIGLCLMSILRKFGLSEIYMIDRLPYRVRFAKDMGATDAFMYGNAVENIKKITKGKGTSCVFDAVGENDAVNDCVDIVGVSGKIGILGIPTKDYITYNPHKLRLKEVSIYNVRRANQTLEDCVRMYAGDTEVEKMVTHESSLEDIQRAFELVSGYKDNVIKCMIVND